MTSTMPFKLLFHVHTRASFDSMMAPETILRYCRDNGIDAVAICDHDSLDGSRKARRLAQIYGVQVIPAVEIATDAGDIIGMFIDELPPTNAIDDVLHHIRDTCGGLAILPHPYRGHDLDRIPLDLIDIIESGNSRCAKEDNRRAKQLADQLAKPEIAGADAHVTGELPNALNTFEVPIASYRAAQSSAPRSNAADDESRLRQLLLTTPRTLQCERSPARYSAMSRMIKGVKKRRPRTLFNAGHALLREEVHRRLWRFAGKDSAK